jgi:L-threonylcarbamoyladenylate synthase
MNDIDKAIEILNDRNGGVVGMPTETVYGLAGSIKSENSIRKIFSVKERPFFDPLIVHVSSIEMAKPLTTNWSEITNILAETFWPGPLTMVLPKSSLVSDLITSGLDSVGIRCPKHAVALDIIERVGHGLAAPSANKFTKTSPTSKQHVESEFGDEVFVVDGGECEVGIESTVIGVFEDHIKIYRPGMLTKDEIKKALPSNIAVDYFESPVSPGQMEHHYMPKKPVTLRSDISEDEKVSSWIVPDSPEQAARELYSKMRLLDNEDTDEIHIVLKQEYKDLETWAGILNRLSKAKTIDLYN